MNQCLKPGELQSLIDKTLTKEKEAMVRQHISQCKKCYDSYIEAKELLYLKDKPVKIRKEVLENIIKAKNPTKDSLIRKFTLIIKATKKAFEVLSDSNFELKSEFISATVKGKTGEKVIGENLVLTKVVDNYLVKLQIDKIRNKKFKLTVFVNDNKTKKDINNLQVCLKVARQEIETLELTKSNLFKYIMPPGDYNLDFIKKSKVLFSIDLKIKSE